MEFKPGLTFLKRQKFFEDNYNEIIVCNAFSYKV